MRSTHEQLLGAVDPYSNVVVLKFPLNFLFTYDVLVSVESQTEFVCYASTDCYGAAVSSLPQKGECCAGRGLSFQSDGLSDCQNCFSELYM